MEEAYNFTVKSSSGTTRSVKPNTPKSASDLAVGIA